MVNPSRLEGSFGKGGGGVGIALQGADLIDCAQAGPESIEVGTAMAVNAPIGLNGEVDVAGMNGGIAQLRQGLGGANQGSLAQLGVVYGGGQHHAIAVASQDIGQGLVIGGAVAAFRKHQNIHGHGLGPSR